MKFKLALLGALALAGSQAMACYTIYDGHNRVVWQGAEPPVDMSLPLHEAVGRRFGAGATLVFNENATCTPVSVAQVARPTATTPPPNTIRMERTGRQYSPSSEAPLLTDRQTAERDHVPYTTVAGDVVMVPPSAAGRVNMPTFSVITSGTAVASAADTRTLGAGPAPVAPDTHTLGAGPAVMPRASKQIVITELRDPPVTIVESNGRTAVIRD